MENELIYTNTGHKPDGIYLSQIERGCFQGLKSEAGLAAVAELHGNPLFWQTLIRKLHIVDILILEILYVPVATATFLKDIVNRMGKYNLHRTAVRSRLDKLESLGLIDLTRSSMTCVNSIPALETNVKKLIICCKMRFKW